MKKKRERSAQERGREKDPLMFGSSLQDSDTRLAPDQDEGMTMEERVPNHGKMSGTHLPSIDQKTGNENFQMEILPSDEGSEDHYQSRNTGASQ